MNTAASILIAEPGDFSSKARDILARAGEVRLSTCTPADLANAFASYDAVWIRLGHRITSEVLGDRPRCRVLATPVTGLDHVDLDACRERGIQVVSLRGETEFLRRIRATAELTLGLLLALLRRIPSAANSVREGEWTRDRFRGHELFEKTAGIVGMGRLGTIVAHYLRALGMRVLGYDPRDDFPIDAAERVATLDDLLAEADVVTLHVAYGASTHHLVGEREFARMKETAVMVNTSRGAILDDRALLEALRTHRIAGAALDVLEGEPDLSTKRDLLEYAQLNDDLILVPHIGGNTYESFEKTEVFLAGRVVAALERST